MNKTETIRKMKINKRFSLNNQITIYKGDCRKLLKNIPNETLQLIITSPPYNIGKEYEKPMSIDEYYEFQKEVIDLCVNKLKPTGSICWEVGNYIDKSSSKSKIIPLDLLLYPIFKENDLQFRNRIIWHFGHGLHMVNRFSGRYETINWYSKTDDYIFNLDDVRVPQKYPGKKHFKGLKKGEYSSNPLGKNPSDVWDIPNVKSNHKEKTIHPCQFPISLVDRLVKSLSDEGDIVFDPFSGVGTSVISAIKNNRKGVGAEINEIYYNISIDRIKQQLDGTLQIRDDKPVYNPSETSPITINPFMNNENHKMLG